MTERKQINKRKIGSDYEEMAVSYLKEKGYEILERNFQAKLGEIDIIAKKGEVIVAFEVKYRSSNRYGSPQVAVTKKKQQHISRVFMLYILKNKLSLDRPYRFDVLALTKDGEIKHIENAFEYSA